MAKTTDAEARGCILWFAILALSIAAGIFLGAGFGFLTFGLILVWLLVFG